MQQQQSESSTRLALKFKAEKCVHERVRFVGAQTFSSRNINKKNLPRVRNTKHKHAQTICAVEYDTSNVLFFF